MATDYDATEFVDTDFQAHKSPLRSESSSARPQSREEIESKIGEIHQELADLKRQKEEKERRLSAVQEAHRRKVEFQSGQQEMVHNLTRGIGLLQEAEFAARRDAEQMAKSLADLRAALSKVEAIREEAWAKENAEVELTRALTTIENSRMEWNSAQLKFPILSGAPATATNAPEETAKAGNSPFAQKTFGELCKLGLALTWPLALVALAGVGVLVAILLSR